MNDLAIIVVSWNTRDLLERCLESVNRYSEGVSTELWVVDNASSDGSADMVRERFPCARLIANRENVGFARANNQVLQQAEGRYLLLLNSDAELHPGALQAMVGFLDGRPDAGGAGPRLLNSDGSLQVSCYPFPTLTREAWRLFHLDWVRTLAVYPMADWDTVSPRRVDAIQGACLALRSTALAGVGLLDEEYFMYSEEIDLCNRLARAGWPMYWVPEGRVTHHGGQSSRQVSSEMFMQLYRSKVQFFAKNRGAGSVHAYRAILLAASLARVALTPAIVLLPERHRREAMAKSRLYRRLIAAIMQL